MSVDRIHTLGACSEALAWLSAQEGSLYDAWRRCERGDWLLWLAARVRVDRRLVVLAACDCAEPALVHVPAGEDRPRVAIETARRWAAGEATLEEVRSAAYAAYDAYAYADAAYAAADAAYAAYAAAAYAAADAADAADADAYAAAAYAAAYAAAAYAYAANAAQAASLAHSARLVRTRIPWRLVRDALEVAS